MSNISNVYVRPLLTTPSHTPGELSNLALINSLPFLKQNSAKVSECRRLWLVYIHPSPKLISCGEVRCHPGQA